jgi:hypothetical protein
MQLVRRTSRARSWRTVSVTLALAGLMTACPWTEPPGPPDAGADGGSLIGRDPACTLTGSLELALGEGEGSMDFTPLAPGQEPLLHYGPQGGTHLILGVRVANPAMQFPGLQVEFKAERQRCDAGGGCLPFETMGRYLTVVSEPSRFLPQDGDAVAVSGILVTVSDWNIGERRRLQVEALDRCGRAGTTVLELDPQTR